MELPQVKGARHDEAPPDGGLDRHERHADLKCGRLLKPHAAQYAGDGDN